MEVSNKRESMDIIEICDMCEVEIQKLARMRVVAFATAQWELLHETSDLLARFEEQLDHLYQLQEEHLEKCYAIPASTAS